MKSEIIAKATGSEGILEALMCKVCFKIAKVLKICKNGCSMIVCAECEAKIEDKTCPGCRSEKYLTNMHISHLLALDEL